MTQAGPAAGVRTPGSRLHRVRLVIGVLLMVMALTAGAVWAWQYFVVERQTERDLGTPVWTPTPSARPSPIPAATVRPRTTPTRPVTPVADAAGCAARLAPLGTPVRFQVPARGVDAAMLSLGVDEKGAAASPPKDEPTTVGWFNEGPRVGSDRGHAVLTAHTYRNGGALGNLLYEPSTGLEPGDIIKIKDAQGRTQCYRYTHSLKVWVDEYDPYSTIIYDFNGKPQVVIVVCWDFDWDTRVWKSRVIFYAEPLAAAS